jgi:hypothetical protein
VYIILCIYSIKVKILIELQTATLEDDSIIQQQQRTGPGRKKPKPWTGAKSLSVPLISALVATVIPGPVLGQLVSLSVKHI